MRLLALLAGALAACGRAPAPAPAVSVLEKAVRASSSAPHCARAIPAEWSPSWPVPARREGRLEYRLFFFGREGDSASGFLYSGPRGSATLAADGTVLECRRTDGASRAAPPDPRFAALGLPELERLASRLYARTETVASLYASGRELTAADRAELASYAGELEQLALSSHKAAYRGLSPAFWTWLDRAAKAE